MRRWMMDRIVVRCQSDAIFSWCDLLGPKDSHEQIIWVTRQAPSPKLFNLQKMPVEIESLSTGTVARIGDGIAVGGWPIKVTY
jgi:hypothetical protein